MFNAPPDRVDSLHSLGVFSRLFRAGLLWQKRAVSRHHDKTRRRHRMPILKIFNPLEIEAFESPPLFNSLERKKFFTLPTQLQQLSHSFSTPTNQVCFILTA